MFVPHLLLAKTKFSQTCSPTTPAPRFSHSDGCSQSNTIRFSQIPDPELQPGSHRQVFQDPQRAMGRHPQPTAVPRNVRNLQQLQPTTYYGITTHLQPANGNGMNNDWELVPSLLNWESLIKSEFRTALFDSSRTLVERVLIIDFIWFEPEHADFFLFYVTIGEDSDYKHKAFARYSLMRDQGVKSYKHWR